MEIRMKLEKPAARGKLLEQLEIQSMVLLAVAFLFIFAYIPIAATR